MPAAIEQYQKLNLQSNLEEANAHKIIQLLMTNALNKISTAICCMKKNDTAEKGLNISIAITMVDALQSSLDLEQGGEVADNLFRLYQYIMEKLVLANMEDKVELLEEAIDFLSTIKSGWDSIEKEAGEILAAQETKQTEQEKKQ